MSLKPGEDIGLETHHDTEQTLVFVAGSGEALLNGEKFPIAPGDLFFVPAGTNHETKADTKSDPHEQRG